jgi:hypothetical protein
MNLFETNENYYNINGQVFEELFEWILTYVGSLREIDKLT